MAAYIAAFVEVLDSEAYRTYSSQVLPLVQKHGGRFLARGGSLEILEGDLTPRRAIILEFPSVAAARTWYASPEYQELLPLRARAAKTMLMMVEGL